MININFIGGLGADSELKSTKDGKQFLTFRIGTDIFTKGERTTAWFRATLFDEKRAVELQSKLTKGTRLLVSGTENVRIWFNQNGEAQLSRDINVTNLEFVPSAKRSEELAEGATQATAEATTSTATPNVNCGTFRAPTAQPTAVPQVSVATNVVDDLPF